MIGIGFFLPILPLFITARGGAPVLVGLVFAAGVVGRAAAQYPAGWLADMVGRKPVIIGALLCYGLLFPLYLVPVAPRHSAAPSRNTASSRTPATSPPTAGPRRSPTMSEARSCPNARPFAGPVRSAIMAVAAGR